MYGIAKPEPKDEGGEPFKPTRQDVMQINEVAINRVYIIPNGRIGASHLPELWNVDASGAHDRAAEPALSKRVGVQSVSRYRNRLG